MGPGLRVSGWEARLTELVESARATPFQWGQHDCATWAFDVRHALTGSDAAQAWRGRFSTARGARKVMLRLGWPDLTAMGMALLGEPLARPVMGQRGDMLIGSDAFGVCIGSHGAFLGWDGLMAMPLRDCALAWRV